MRVLWWVVGWVAGCGQQYWSSGVRPGPVGVPRVVLLGRGDAFVPVACYDPLWVRLAGPADCADLIPPGAQVLDPAGKTWLLGPRRPTRCGGQPAVAFPAVGAQGRAVWPPEAPPDWSRIDLDQDGQPEVLTAGDGLQVRRAERIFGACPQTE